MERQRIIFFVEMSATFVEMVKVGRKDVFDVFRLYWHVNWSVEEVETGVFLVVLFNLLVEAVSEARHALLSCQEVLEVAKRDFWG